MSIVGIFKKKKALRRNVLIVNVRWFSMMSLDSSAFPIIGQGQFNRKRIF